MGFCCCRQLLCLHTRGSSKSRCSLCLFQQCLPAGLRPCPWLAALLLLQLLLLLLLLLLLEELLLQRLLLLLLQLLLLLLLHQLLLLLQRLLRLRRFRA